MSSMEDMEDMEDVEDMDEALWDNLLTQISGDSPCNVSKVPVDDRMVLVGELKQSSESREVNPEPDVISNHHESPHEAMQEAEHEPGLRSLLLVENMSRQTDDPWSLLESPALASTEDAVPPMPASSIANQDTMSSGEPDRRQRNEGPLLLCPDDPFWSTYDPALSSSAGPRVRWVWRGGSLLHG